MGFIVRAGRLPIVEVVYPAAFVTSEYRELFERYAQLSLEHRRLAYLVDLRGFKPLNASAAHRKIGADIFNEFAPVLVPATVCEARIVTDQLTRGIVTAFDWLTGSKWPCRTFTSPSEAEAWVREQLATNEPSRTFVRGRP